MSAERMFDDYISPSLRETKAKVKRNYRLVANRLDLTKTEQRVMIVFRGRLPITDEELISTLHQEAEKRNKKIISAKTIIKHRISLSMKGAIRNSGQTRPDDKGNQSIIWEAISE